MQAHADYVAPSPSVASQAAQYSIMDINSLTKAAKAGQAGAQFYLATKYQYGKDIQKMNDRPLPGIKLLRIKVWQLHS